jgi:phage terminase Nu1 subunit (DNA packaging protein)
MTLIALPTERHVTTHELAEIMGVSVSTIKRMRLDGMPSVTWGRRTRRYLPSKALQWARERGKA